jgi:hypothetical protein
VAGGLLAKTGGSERYAEASEISCRRVLRWHARHSQYVMRLWRIKALESQLDMARREKTEIPRRLAASENETAIERRGAANLQEVVTVLLRFR